jgi:hypothetical protein
MRRRRIIPVWERGYRISRGVNLGRIRISLARSRGKIGKMIERGRPLRRKKATLNGSHRKTPHPPLLLSPLLCPLLIPPLLSPLLLSLLLLFLLLSRRQSSTHRHRLRHSSSSLPLTLSSIRSNRSNNHPKITLEIAHRPVLPGSPSSPTPTTPLLPQAHDPSNPLQSPKQSNSSKPKSPSCSRCKARNASSSPTST